MHIRVMHIYYDTKTDKHLLYFNGKELVEDTNHLQIQPSLVEKVVNLLSKNGSDFGANITVDKNGIITDIKI